MFTTLHEVLFAYYIALPRNLVSFLDNEWRSQDFWENQVGSMTLRDGGAKPLLKPHLQAHFKPPPSEALPPSHPPFTFGGAPGGGWDLIAHSSRASARPSETGRRLATTWRGHGSCSACASDVVATRDVLTSSREDGQSSSIGLDTATLQGDAWFRWGLRPEAPRMRHRADSSTGKCQGCSVGSENSRELSLEEKLFVTALRSSPSGDAGQEVVSTKCSACGIATGILSRLFGQLWNRCLHISIRLLHHGRHGLCRPMASAWWQTGMLVPHSFSGRSWGTTTLRSSMWGKLMEVPRLRPQDQHGSVATWVESRETHSCLCSFVWRSRSS